MFQNEQQPYSTLPTRCFTFSDFWSQRCLIGQLFFSWINFKNAAHSCRFLNITNPVLSWWLLFCTQSNSSHPTELIGYSIKPDSVQNHLFGWISALTVCCFKKPSTASPPPRTIWMFAAFLWPRVFFGDCVCGWRGPSNFPCKDLNSHQKTRMYIISKLSMFVFFFLM